MINDYAKYFKLGEENNIILSYLLKLIQIIVGYYFKKKVTK